MTELVNYEYFSDDEHPSYLKLLACLPKVYKKSYHVVYNCTKKLPFHIPIEIYCKILKYICLKKIPINTSLEKMVTLNSGRKWRTYVEDRGSILNGIHNYITTPYYQLIEPLFLLNPAKPTTSWYRAGSNTYLEWFYNNKPGNVSDLMLFTIQDMYSSSKKEGFEPNKVHKLTVPWYFIGLVCNDKIKIKNIQFGYTYNTITTLIEESIYQKIKLTNICNVSNIADTNFFNNKTYEWYTYDDILKTPRTDLDIMYFDCFRNPDIYSGSISFEVTEPIDKVQIIACSVRA